MKFEDTLITALRLWFVTVILTSVMIGISVDTWVLAVPIMLIATVITLPVPFVANYCIKLAFQISPSFLARFANTCFFLIMLAGLFWAILIAMLGGTGMDDVKVAIGLNFLSILIACTFSIRQLRRLNDVTSEETVPS